MVDAIDVLDLYGLRELLTLKPINACLEDVPFVLLETEDDFKKIPKKGGVYYIATNEPIHHSFHNHINKHPNKLPDGSEIIYNGTAQDLQERAKKHLLRTVNKGMSAVSIDILTTCEKVESHTKCCFSKNYRQKTPFITDSKRIKALDDVLKLNLSEEEKIFVENHHPNENIYLKNGINVFDKKHLVYRYKFYYQPIDSHNVRDIIETNWRKQHGIPRLCTYVEGR
jgi:hypothetical protein